MIGKMRDMVTAAVVVSAADAAPAAGIRLSVIPAAVAPAMNFFHFMITLSS